MKSAFMLGILKADRVLNVTCVTVYMLTNWCRFIIPDPGIYYTHTEESIHHLNYPEFYSSFRQLLSRFLWKQPDHLFCHFLTL